MKEIFVTYFDSLFLPQALCLIESLNKFIKLDFQLWIICCDDKSFHILNKLKFKNIILLKLWELENNDLKLLKKERNLREYYWTITPYTFLWVYHKNKNIKRITYIDADLYFLKDPKNIIKEFIKSEKDFFVTKHSYRPEIDQSDTSGIYCVQFLSASFPDALPIINHWRKSCTDWCYERFQDGKYGDQKYIEDLIDIFPEKIHILQNESFAQAPWNIGKFCWSDAVFYHFQGLRINKKYIVDFGYFQIPRNIFSNIYLPYLKKLDDAIYKLEKLGWKFLPQGKEITLLRRIIRRLRVLKTKIDYYIFYKDQFKLR